MRLKEITAALVALAVGFSVFAPATYAFGDYRYIAHRGRISTSQPANQLSTFKVAAANRYVYGIETDIWRTKDGRYVCIHGSGGKSADWGGKEVTETNYAVLKNLHPNGGTLCTLGRYLDVCRSGGKKAVIELKDRRLAANGTYTKKIVGICKSHKMLDDCIFISFQPAAVNIAKRYASARYGVCVQGYALARNSVGSVNEALAAAKKYKLTGISVDKGQVSYASKARARARGKLEVCVWTYKSKRLALADFKAYAPATVTGEFKPGQFH